MHRHQIFHKLDARNLWALPFAGSLGHRPQQALWSLLPNIDLSRMVSLSLLAWVTARERCSPPWVRSRRTDITPSDAKYAPIFARRLLALPSTSACNRASILT